MDNIRVKNDIPLPNDLNARINSQTREESSPKTESSDRYRTGIVNFSQSIPWHWHTETECFCLQNGSITLDVPSGEYFLQPGDVVFINSGVLHRLTPQPRESCSLQNHIFLPRMISGENPVLQAQYITPLVENAAAPILVFRNGTEETAKLSMWMNEAHEAHTQKLFAYELITRDCMSRAWALFAAHMPDYAEQSDNKDAQRLMLMLQYIGEHYAEKLDLGSIAASAHISSKECERCFQKQIKMTPFEYIMDYRLEKARGLLAQKSPAGVTEIGLQCGFATTSYFGKRFKEKYKLSPRKYRVKMQNTAE